MTDSNAPKQPQPNQLIAAIEKLIAGMAKLEGTDGNDILSVSPDLKDKKTNLDSKTTKCEIYGKDGNDIIKGGNVTSNLMGGKGDDIIHAGSVGDNLYGYHGNDTLFGGPGWDHFEGGSGKDTIYGGAYRDKIHGDYHPINDSTSIPNLYPENEPCDDTLYGEDGDDEIHGQLGNDTLDGGEGNDILFGGKGNDYIRTGNGTDEIYGGTGNDYILGEGVGQKIIYGDEGLYNYNCEIKTLEELANNKQEAEKPCGNDVLVAMSQNNILVGDGIECDGQDMFVIHNVESSKNTIIDFNPIDDHILLKGHKSDDLRKFSYYVTQTNEPYVKVEFKNNSELYVRYGSPDTLGLLKRFGGTIDHDLDSIFNPFDIATDENESVKLIYKTGPAEVAPLKLMFENQSEIVTLTPESSHEIVTDQQFKVQLPQELSFDSAKDYSFSLPSIGNLADVLKDFEQKYNNTQISLYITQDNGLRPSTKAWTMGEYVSQENTMKNFKPNEKFYLVPKNYLRGREETIGNSVTVRLALSGNDKNTGQQVSTLFSNETTLSLR